MPHQLKIIQNECFRMGAISMDGYIHVRILSMSWLHIYIAVEIIITDSVIKFHSFHHCQLLGVVGWSRKVKETEATRCRCSPSFAFSHVDAGVFFYCRYTSVVTFLLIALRLHVYVSVEILKKGKTTETAKWESSWSLTPLVWPHFSHSLLVCTLWHWAFPREKTSWACRIFFYILRFR